jgi:hypothetical protein
MHASRHGCLQHASSACGYVVIVDAYNKMLLIVCVPRILCRRSQTTCMCAVVFYELFSCTETMICTTLLVEIILTCMRPLNWINMRSVEHILSHKLRKCMHVCAYKYITYKYVPKTRPNKLYALFYFESLRRFHARVGAHASNVLQAVALVQEQTLPPSLSLSLSLSHVHRESTATHQLHTQEYAWQFTPNNQCTSNFIQHELKAVLIVTAAFTNSRSCVQTCVPVRANLEPCKLQATGKHSYLAGWRVVVLACRSELAGTCSKERIKYL